MKVSDIIGRAQQDQAKAVGLADNANLFGAVRFHRGALAAGIKPIHGMVLPVAHKGGSGEMAVYARNAAGYGALCRLSTNAHLDHKRDSKSGVEPLPMDALLAEADGLVCLSGAELGPLGQDPAGDPDALGRLKEAFGDRFHLELHRTGTEGQDAHVLSAVQASVKHGVPVVATQPSWFSAPQDVTAYRLRRAVQEGVTLRGLPAMSDEQLSCKSGEEMAELFADIPAALENSISIAHRCTMPMELGHVLMPSFPMQAGQTEEGRLRQDTEAGLARRLGALNDEYQQRLRYELGVIEKMGYAGYFLIVAEFVSWAKENRVPVGPGRGSGAGSLVAYGLGITDVDPMRYGLMFERFLNPERVSMPDFDIDFCRERRNLVLQHVKDLYGHGSASQIVTFGTVGAKAAVRDSCRVMGMPYTFGSDLVRWLDDKKSVRGSIEASSVLQKMMRTDPKARDVMESAMTLEGLTRNIGKHAGGLVIAPGDLTEQVPLYREGPSSTVVTQYDKDDVELAGMVKFDFLGLSNLTTLQHTLDLLGEDAPDLSSLPLDDPKTLKLLQAGDAIGVFQFEGEQMRALMRELKPERFEDLAALISLYRPGPIETNMHKAYINRANGRAAIEYPHPLLEPVLKNTYGVFVYQEQVMGAAQALAGYSLGEADILRRAMGKKKPEEMAKQRSVFVKRANELHGLTAAEAEQIFSIIEGFAGYGFNASHAVAYSMISWQCAYLKANHPAEYMAALLTTKIGDEQSDIAKMAHETKRMGLTILPPDINRSQGDFTVEDGSVRFGLGAVRQLGGRALKALLDERKAGGEFTSFNNFIGRVRLNKDTLTSLIESGALSAWGTQPQLLALVSGPSGQKAAADQMNLLGGGDSPADEDIPQWTEKRKQQAEARSMGVYLSSHPLNGWDGQLSDATTHTVAQLPDEGSLASATVAGVIVKRSDKSGKDGVRSRMMLEDRTGGLMLNVPPNLLAVVDDEAQEGEIVIASGPVQGGQHGRSMRAHRVETLDAQLQKRYAAAHCEPKTPASAQAMEAVLDEASPGPCSVMGRAVLLTADLIANLRLHAEVRLSADVDGAPPPTPGVQHREADREARLSANAKRRAGILDELESSLSIR